MHHQSSFNFSLCSCLRREWARCSNIWVKGRRNDCSGFNKRGRREVREAPPPHKKSGRILLAAAGGIELKFVSMISLGGCGCRMMKCARVSRTMTCDYYTARVQRAGHQRRPREQLPVVRELRCSAARAFADFGCMRAASGGPPRRMRRAKGRPRESVNATRPKCFLFHPINAPPLHC